MKKAAAVKEQKIRFEKLVGEFMAFNLMLPTREAWDMAAMTLQAALEPEAIPFTREELDVKRRLLLTMANSEVHVNPLKLELAKWFVNACLNSLDGKIDFGKRR